MPGKDSVAILQEAGWAPGPVWTGGKSRPHRDSIPDRPARSQSLYRLSYQAHVKHLYEYIMHQTQQILMCYYLGQHVSTLIELSSGPSKIQILINNAENA